MTDRLRLATLEAAPVRARARLLCAAFATCAAFAPVAARAGDAALVTVTPPADVVSVPIEPLGMDVSVPAGPGVAATVVFPACEAAPGTRVSIRPIATARLAPSALAGTVLAAHTLSFDRDVRCRALPSIYYALPAEQQKLPLVAEITDGRGTSLGTIDQYRFGTDAFEGGMFPETAALTETTFAAGIDYEIGLRADSPSMTSEPVAFAPSDLMLPGAAGLAFAAHLPAAISGGGRIVVRTSTSPPAGIPPLTTTNGTPALAYISAIVYGNAVFAGDARLAVTKPSGLDSGLSLALYDAERWTAGWTSPSLTRSRDDAGRYVFALTTTQMRAIYKRVIFAIYPEVSGTDAGFVSEAYVPPAGKPIVALIGDSTSILTANPPSPVGCKLDFAPVPSCQMSPNPALGMAGRLAGLTGDEIVQLAWLSSAVGDIQDTDSEFTWEVPQIPRETTTIVFMGGLQDVAWDDPPALRSRVDAIVAAMRARAPRARIVLVGQRYFNDIVHMPARMAAVDAWNEREREVAAAAGGAFVDARSLDPPGPSAAYPDGAHPTPETTLALARAIAAHLTP